MFSIILRVCILYSIQYTLYSNVQKDFVTSLFTRDACIEYYLMNAYLCGHLIVKHIQISYIDSIFFNLCNDISFVTIEQYFLLVIVMESIALFSTENVFVSSIVQEPLSVNCQDAINPKDHHFYYHSEVQKIWKLTKKASAHIVFVFLYMWIYLGIYLYVSVLYIFAVILIDKIKLHY